MRKKYIVNASVVERFDVRLCRQNPNKLYVFGDNFESRGTAGQACIRYEPNSIGIPTKRKPSMDDDAFMSDTDYDIKAMLMSIYSVVESSKYYNEVVFPKDGLGTGLAKMPEKSPIAYRLMNSAIEELFGIYLSN